MILGANKDPVVENIRRAVEAGDFHRKVEVDDPVVTPNDAQKLLAAYMREHGTLHYRFNNRLARLEADVAGSYINRNTTFTGLENIKNIRGGYIVTANHFNPADSYIARSALKKVGRSRMFIVSQDENLAVPGWAGFFMRFTDIIPITDSKNDTVYMTRHFPAMLETALLQKKCPVLIFPESEMWINYRKPRPLKRGAYFYAAKYNVPVVPIFVELRVVDGKYERDDFYQTRYVVHVLPPIYPDASRSHKQNSYQMRDADQAQKQKAYETAYRKALDYTFSLWDIAGWIEPKDRIKKA